MKQIVWTAYAVFLAALNAGNVLAQEGPGAAMGTGKLQNAYDELPCSYFIASLDAACAQVAATCNAPQPNLCRHSAPATATLCLAMGYGKNFGPEQALLSEQEFEIAQVVIMQAAGTLAQACQPSDACKVHKTAMEEACRTLAPCLNDDAMRQAGHFGAGIFPAFLLCRAYGADMDEFAQTGCMIEATPTSWEGVLHAVQSAVDGYQAADCSP